MRTCNKYFSSDPVKPADWSLLGSQVAQLLKQDCIQACCRVAGT